MDNVNNWHTIVISIGAPLIVAGYCRALAFTRELERLAQQVMDMEKRMDRLEKRIDEERNPK
jgi:hypothetical protein